MSRSQGAANGGWPPAQRHPAGEPDPRSGGRPAQRPQVQQPPQAPQSRAPQPQAPQYGAPPQQPAAYPQQGYGEPQRPAHNQGHAYNNGQPYHYPQQAPQYGAPPVAQPAAPAVNRQALSSLDSARNAPPPQEFDNFPRTQPPPQYTHPPQAAARAQYAAPVAEKAPGVAGGAYRQAPQPAPQYAPAPRAPAPSYQSWPDAQPVQDPYGQELGGYPPMDGPYAANGNQPHLDALQQADWALPAAGYGDPAHDPQAYGHGQLGYDQAHGGALEPTYNQEEEVYDSNEPRRSSWTLRIAGAVVVAIGLGYGLAQAYKAVLGSPPDQAPPVVASNSAPAKEKPLDPGGKQFSHTDSKVLGRLGDGGPAPAEPSSNDLSASDTSNNGSRQVKTLVVGRDGSIAPPSASAEPAAASAPEPTVSVPGLTVVDAFGSAAQHAAPQRVAAAELPPRQPDPEPAAVSPPPKARVNVKSTRVIPASTASLPDQEPSQAPAAPAAPKRQKVAVATAAGEGATSAGGANGYVVVLASVPASGTSRLDALRKFADMQQQYGSVLVNKTPDVRETTLAGKGPYHRLLVGPPGSRSQASELCTQLKAYGYKDCWVTAY